MAGVEAGIAGEPPAPGPGDPQSAHGGSTSALIGDPEPIRIYRVTQIDDDGCRLRLEAEKKGPSGWTSFGGIVPIEQAIDFFTDRILVDRKDAFSFIMRAVVWYDKADFDKAIADDTEAIRLGPQNIALAELERLGEKGSP